jgi:hypothetical protein
VNQYRQHFADELTKMALAPKGSTPPVSTFAPVKGGTVNPGGAGVSIPQVTPPKPAVTAPKTLSPKVPSTVPLASGKNLGTKFSPRPKKAPSPIGGTSLVR